MLTLAVDTVAEFGSIALADAAGVRDEILLHEPRGFGQILFTEIDRLLHRQGITLAEIDLFAGASGPGSFTGVRIGLAAIKGLAEVTRKPAIGISNLAAMATFGTARLRGPVIDAHRGEVFAAVFDVDGAEIFPESVLPLTRFLDSIAAGDVEFLVTELLPAMQGTAVPRNLAGAVAQLAIRQQASGVVSDPAVIEANYVRRADAEFLWRG